MAFKKMVKSKYPPRLWELRGYAGSGKSTFAAQMRAPILPVDADNRFTEVVHLADGDVYALSDEPADNTDARRIAELLDANMPGSDVATIVVDSLTTIIAPLVSKAIQANDAGENKNRIAAFKEKALAMRTLQDAVTKWGCDVLLIYHLDDARDANAKAVTRASISETELARLMRSVNLKLEMVEDRGRRGVKVVWARRGRSGMVLWDDTGSWRGMPEKIEQAVYDGLTDDERARLERGEVAVFPSPEVALAWAVERGAFEEEVHARNAYDKLKREKQPKTAYEMAALWIGEVQGRLGGEEALTPGPSPASGRGEAERRGETEGGLTAGEALTPGPSPTSGRGEAEQRGGGGLTAGEALTPGPSPAGGRGEAEQRDGEAASPAAVPGPVEGTTASSFWREFYKLEREKRIPQGLRDAPEILAAQATGNWDHALRWLRGLGDG